jgi:protein-disulfide isomerase
MSMGYFLPLHQIMLERAESLGTRTWNSYAQQAGIFDSSRFDSCLESALPDTVLDADVQAGLRLSVSVTPTFLVNNELYVGVPWDLERIVERHIRSPIGAIEGQ